MPAGCALSYVMSKPPHSLPINTNNMSEHTEPFSMHLPPACIPVCDVIYDTMCHRGHSVSAVYTSVYKHCIPGYIMYERSRHLYTLY